MRIVSFWGKYTSGSRISASRSDLLTVPISGDHERRMNSIVKLRLYRHGLPLKPERRPYGTRERRRPRLSRRLQLKPCRSSAVDCRYKEQRPANYHLLHSEDSQTRAKQLQKTLHTSLILFYSKLGNVLFSHLPRFLCLLYPPGLLWSHR